MPSALIIVGICYALTAIVLGGLALVSVVSLRHWARRAREEAKD